MRKLGLFTILVLVLIVLASCAEPVTPAAYTRFDASGDEYVFYNSLVYLDQIKVYRNKDAFDNNGDPDMVFDFPKCLGKDELDGISYIVVDLSQSPVYLSVTVSKDSPSYGESKKFYLNGTALAPSDTFNMGSSVIFRYEKLDLVRTNPKGQIDSSAVNYIEYK